MDADLFPERLFLTGTDTGVGKTYAACLLLREWARAGHRPVAVKPFCCGDRGDAFQLHAACGRDDLSVDQVNPLWLRVPAAPYVAAMIENRPVDLPRLLQHCQDSAALGDRVLVEGAGGWEVPLRADVMLSDFARDLGWPVVVVVRNQLGALNHTILTVRAIAAAGLVCAGLVINHPADERDPASISNRAVLEDVLGVPVLAEIMHGEAG